MMTTPALPRFSLPPDVVAMPVRVHEKPDRLFRDRLHRGHDLGRERCELVVDQKHAVLASRNADVPAFAFQHVDAVGHLRGFDLYRVEIALLSPGAEAETRDRQCNEHFFHAASFSSSQALSGRGSPARSCAVSLRSGSIFSVSRISISWRVCCAGCQAVRSSTTCRGCLPK